MTRMKKANGAVKELQVEIRDLKKEVNSGKVSVQRQLELGRKLQELEALRQTVEDLQQAIGAIPPVILEKYQNTGRNGKEYAYLHEDR